MLNLFYEMIAPVKQEIMELPIFVVSVKERRVSDLLHRALPTPPVSRHVMDDLDPNDDTYEMVALDEDDNPAMPYIEEKPTETKKVVSDYLEPISHKQSAKINGKTPFMYVSAHTTHSNCGTPLTQLDGFHQMAALQEGTLHQLMFVLIGEYSGQEKIFGGRVLGRELDVIAGNKPQHTNHKISIYSSIYHKHYPLHCTLMVSTQTTAPSITNTPLHCTLMVSTQTIAPSITNTIHYTVHSW